MVNADAPLNGSCQRLTACYQKDNVRPHSRKTFFFPTMTIILKIKPANDSYESPWIYRNAGALCCRGVFGIEIDIYCSFGQK